MGSKKLAANNPYAPNNGGQNPFGRSAAPTNTGDNTNIFGQSVGGGAATQAPFGSATTNSGNQLPDGSEPASFLRVARQRFNHIQSINSASNIEEIRRYLTLNFITLCITTSWRTKIRTLLSLVT